MRKNLLDRRSQPRYFADPARKNLATIGRRVQASAGDERWRGVAVSVDEDGALLIRLADGAIQRVLAGDVTLREH